LAVPAPLFSILSDGLKLSVRLTPKSSRDALDGKAVLSDGRVVLKAHVRALPDKGKANKALIVLLAKTLKLAKTQVTLASGATSRIKTIKLEGEPAELKHRLEAVLAGKAQEKNP